MTRAQKAKAVADLLIEFRPGDHVRVVAGPYRRSTGRIALISTTGVDFPITVRITRPDMRPEHVNYMLEELEFVSSDDD